MPDAPYWLPSPVSTFALGSGPVLVLDRNRLAVREIEPVVAAVFSRCQGVRPLQDHIAQAWTAGVPPTPTAITNAIDALVSHGLLRPIAIGSTELHGEEGPTRQPQTRAATDPAVPSPAAIGTVSIVTADRPEALARALNALGCDRASARPLHVIVVDGSSTDGAATRAAVANVHRSIAAQYVGPDEAAEVRHHLESRGIPAAVLDSGLTPGPVGSGRNLTTLLTAGRPLLMHDDDVIAKLWTGEAPGEGLAIGGHTDLRAWRFFETRDRARAAIRDVEGDAIATHAAVLGCSLDNLIARSGDRVDYSHACGHMVAALHDAAERKVRVTFAGLAGDAARYCSHGLMFQPGAVRQRIWESDSVFALAVSSREVAIVAPSLTVTHDSACVSYCMGIDNTSLVPPFMPAGRNADGVWGATLAFMDPRALFAHLPWGIWHDSHRPSRYGESMPSARQSRVSDFLLFVITRVAPATFATGPADRLRRLGRLFRDVAALPAGDFRAFVAEAKLGTLSQILTHAGTTASDPACPPHWRQALDEYQRAFRENVARPGYFLPIEFTSDSLEDGFARMQQFVAQFGDLLNWWPEMWEVARSMNEERQVGGNTT